jgi:hypothetical protein
MEFRSTFLGHLPKGEYMLLNERTKHLSDFDLAQHILEAQAHLVARAKDEQKGHASREAYVIFKVMSYMNRKKEPVKGAVLYAFLECFGIKKHEGRAAVAELVSGTKVLRVRSDLQIELTTPA